MSLTTPLLDVKRILEELLNRLPQPLRERLLFLRRTHPKTPLQSLPKPVRTEVKSILTSAGATTAETSATHRPVLPHGQRHSQPSNGTPRSARAGTLRTPDASILGTDTTGREIGITLKDRRQGLYVIGANGVGKTTLLEQLILADIHAGRGVALIEPHGDLTAKILGGIAPQRIKDVFYLDVEDVEYPFGLGLFEVASPRNIRTMAATASFISHLWEVLWNSGFDTPRLMQNLRAVTRTLISNRGSSFADIPLLYSCDSVRQNMLANVTNPQVIQFWEDYERKNQRDRDLFTESTLNKVTSFLDEPMIQHILSQAKTTIDLRYIMDNSKILLIKLSPQYEEASKLIGAVIIGKILMTAFSRADTPEDKRKDFCLYCDEFHRFASSDFATLISEARKFRINTTISHQTLTQISEQNRASALAAGNIICFRVSGDDAHVLCRSFDTTPTPQVIINGEEPVRSPTTDPITHLVTRGHNDPRVARFAQTYLHNLEYFLKTPSSSAVAYVKEWQAAYYNGVDGTLILYDQHLQQGRKLLNQALYACMSEANPNLYIPILAIYILAAAQRDRREYVFSPYIKHYNHGFFFGPFSLETFEESARKFGEAWFVEPQRSARYIAAVAKYAKKEQCMAEAVVSMLTELRYVMTVLSSHSPILVDTGQYRPRLQTQIQTFQDRENQIARDLANAPNYYARVKLVSGGEYTIRTNPVAETLTGNALTQRLQAIKRHMQALGVIRHYTDVAAEIRARQMRLLGITDTAPEDTDEPPPSDSFSLE